MEKGFVSSWQLSSSEKKRCLRCYRLHKKCDSELPECTRCKKSKTNCVYTYTTTDDNSMYIQQPQAVQNLYNTIVSLRRGLEEQKDSYRNLEERFHRLERENRQLEMTNFKLTQALTNTNLLAENHLSLSSKLQDLLVLYRSTGFYYLRVVPLISEISVYWEEKLFGGNSLRVATMDLIFSCVYLLGGKNDNGMDCLNNARMILQSNSTNTPLNTVCTHMIANLHFLLGQFDDALSWWQRLQLMLESSNHPHHHHQSYCLQQEQARHEGLIDSSSPTQNMKILRQIMDVDFARHASLNWLQFAMDKSGRTRIKQYQYQKSLWNEFIKNHTVDNCCSKACYLAIKLWSEIMIAIEQAVSDVATSHSILFEDALLTSLEEITSFQRTITSDKLANHTLLFITIMKAILAVVTGDLELLNRLLQDPLLNSCFEQPVPDPFDACYLFIYLQLLNFIGSSYFSMVWASRFPVFARYFSKWQWIFEDPSIPSIISQMEDYFVVLPYLYRLQSQKTTLRFISPDANKFFAQPVIAYKQSSNIEDEYILEDDSSNTFYNYEQQTYFDTDNIMSDNSTFNPTLNNFNNDQRNAAQYHQLPFCQDQETNQVKNKQ